MFVNSEETGGNEEEFVFLYQGIKHSVLETILVQAPFRKRKTFANMSAIN